MPKENFVVLYQENRHSIRATANKFEIEPKQLENELLGWFRELRSQLKTVTRFMIGVKARSLANKQEYHTLYPDIHRCQFSHK
ncbi:6771_t:CDS:2 [Scutellospora calospora]|uniref:6771_t:CDS:1 n=1 Tax=Scutellospora calospora TaxID=85575 RepID=A0ACA9MJ09_9GLOM|nr:6771_t:CDS:2 [Scutellospora calospora]